MTRRPSARFRLARVAAAISLALAAALCTPATARADYAGFRDVGASDWYVTDGYLDYALSDATVYRTYVTTARGLEGPAMGYYGLLDRTPKGRPGAARPPTTFSSR